MKIKQLHIKKYKHLEKLDFDFTYQSGEKKGQPLEKICFIGQSATGKTNLLDLITYVINDLYELIYNKYGFTPVDSIRGLETNVNVVFETKKGEVSFSEDEVKIRGTILRKNYNSGTFDRLFNSEDKDRIIYLKSNIISKKNMETFQINPIELIEKNPGLENISFSNKSFFDDIIIFDDETKLDIWVVILSEILDYRKKFSQKMSELLHKGFLANQKKLQTEFEKWQLNNPNKLEEFSNKFNPLIEKLNLEVDIINTEFSIPIKNKYTDEVFPIQNTSTGTKGLLLSFLPLHYLNEKDSIIIIDEPERSLYPDMQIDLMEHYQNISPDSQFIIATHSPFIAAAFEPDERFILYFNENGKVEVRRGDSPIGDDPNDILKNDFGINYYNKYGEEAYKTYLKLKEDLANEKNPIKKKELLLETVKLGDKYNF